MYQVGIERLFYAGAASDSAVFFGRLSEHDAKWTLSLSNQELRHQVGLPIDERDMVAKQLLTKDMLAVFKAFIDCHTYATSAGAR